MKSFEFRSVRGNQVPFSEQFKDIYFSPEDGLAETDHVFIESNRLRERFQDVEQFSIGELGFGTGLNFFRSWQLWADLSAPSGVLQYVAFESTPLWPEEIREALEKFPQLRPYVERFLKDYRLSEEGPTEIGIRRFDFGRVSLTLVIGDARDWLPQVVGPVRSWYFDGFAPSRNPQLWVDVVFQQVARLSIPEETRFGTFSCAQSVRRSLSRAGFRVERRSGFGNKRRMLTGVFAEESPWRSPKPWLEVPQRKKRSRSSRVVVIGGGIAGTSIAARLAQRGWQVDLLEEGPTLATGASGNDVVTSFPVVTAEFSNRSEFYLSGFGFVRRWLESMGLYHRTGGVQILTKPRTESRLRSAMDRRYFEKGLFRFVDAAEASALAGVTIREKAIYCSDAGWVPTRSVCEAHAATPGVTVHLNSKVDRLFRTSQWILGLADGRRLESDWVVLAQARGVTDLGLSDALEMSAVRGQILKVKTRPALASLKTVLSFNGFLSPAENGEHILGATYDREQLETVPFPTDSRMLLETLQKRLPDFEFSEEDVQAQARSAIRASTRDTMPLIGAMPDQVAFERSFGGLARGVKGGFPSAEWLPGLYVTAGHGSHGLISAHFGAEILTSMMMGEPLPISKRVADALNPARLVIREIKKPSVEKSDFLT